MQTAISQVQEGRLGCFAVRVRLRAEVTITEALRRKGYEVLLPTYVHRKQYTDRIHKANCALFPGYVFVRLDPQSLLGVLTTNGVQYVVKSAGSVHPMAEHEERLLESLLNLASDCEPCALPQVGQRVTICSGPFKHQQGTLVRIDGRNQLVLSLSSIFSSVTVPLNDVEIVQDNA